MLKEIGNGSLVMGIVNVTPDSFSDGGLYNTTEAAISHGQELIKQGADILDIGGESTRPQSKMITVSEELSRVIPVIQGLKGKVKYISIDSRNSETMRQSIINGANIVNDVSALTHDPEAVHVVAQENVYVCLMHMQGTPQTMQINPQYDDVVEEVKSFLADRIEYCLRNNVKHEKIILDIGIGFGKTLEHNLLLLKNLHEFKDLGFPILLGTSRKSFISAIMGEELKAQNRLGGSLASVLWGADQGCKIFRVHDVAQTKQALSVYQAIKMIGN